MFYCANLSHKLLIDNVMPLDSKYCPSCWAAQSSPTNKSDGFLIFFLMALPLTPTFTDPPPAQVFNRGPMAAFLPLCTGTKGFNGPWHEAQWGQETGLSPPQHMQTYNHIHNTHIGVCASILSIPAPILHPQPLRVLSFQSFRVKQWYQKPQCLQRADPRLNTYVCSFLLCYNWKFHFPCLNFFGMIISYFFSPQKRMEKGKTKSCSHVVKSFISLVCMYKYL